MPEDPRVRLSLKTLSAELRATALRRVNGEWGAGRPSPAPRSLPNFPGMRRRRRRSVVSRLALVVLGLVTSVWLASAAGVVFWSHRDEAEPADAIVVLGAAQYVGRPSPVLKARLDHAISLWERQMAPRVIFTGGFGAGDTTSEAAVSRRYAIKHGVPDSAIILEDRGRTTSESMRSVAALGNAWGVRRVILVSDPFHMMRLGILARRFDLEPYTSPTPTSPISANRSEAWKYVLSESVKVPLAFVMERRNP
jgi:uncharacterized SAM-binding protein YcdF (DUF218 family)